MLSEACRVLRGLWREERFSFEGHHYRLRDAACAPKPVQEPLPLLLGGQGEHRALAIVARHADLWNLSGSADTLRAKRAVLERHCARVGRDPRSITVTVRNDFLLTDDPALAGRRIARFARYAGLEDAEARRRTWIGTADEVVASLREFAAAGCDECILALEPPYGAATHEMLARTAAEVVPRLAP
jgi:alkanesulfonate monooxygenase SsuD/methylene tetrahydromethanopterin reductase-like flavin-dependent oxidoreductase (luciferase family)